jgi:hypothetical protein
MLLRGKFLSVKYLFSSAHKAFIAPIGNSSNTLAHSSQSPSQQLMTPWAKKV